MSIPAFNAVSVEAKSQLISAENLAVGYRDLVVWREANFTIEQGEFVAVIGPNGAGKTQLSSACSSEFNVRLQVD